MGRERGRYVDFEKKMYDRVSTKSDQLIFFNNGISCYYWSSQLRISILKFKDKSSISQGPSEPFTVNKSVCKKITGATIVNEIEKPFKFHVNFEKSLENMCLSICLK